MLKITFDDLLTIFESNQVPKHSYAFDDDGNAGQCWVIQLRNAKWHVYYSERGNRDREHVYDTEDEACRFMLSRVAISLWYSNHQKMPGLPSDIS